MLTRIHWTSRRYIKVLFSVLMLWSTAGVLKLSLQHALIGLAAPPALCRTTCLPIPERNSGGVSDFIAWPFERAARGAEPEKAEARPVEDGPLFDGKSLDGWKESEFAGQGSVEVVDGRIVLGVGQDMTGITWDGGELPRTNYEIELEAMRVDGADFFCGLTFPVGEHPCSLIVGGWGGTIVGLSSIDRFDASMNETTKFMSFDKNQWYKIRLRVTPERVAAWIDDEQVVDFEIKSHKISVRVEVQASEPLGIASWQTSAALRNIRLRRLDAAQTAPDSEGQVPARE
jgi:hypothetical protein